MHPVGWRRDGGFYMISCVHTAFANANINDDDWVDVDDDDNDDDDGDVDASSVHTIPHIPPDHRIMSLDKTIDYKRKFDNI